MINQRVIAIAVAVMLGVLGAVQLASPESLGISAVAARWCGILATGLGVLATFLPRVTGPTTDPVQIADRIDAMPAEDRATVRTLLERRHGAPPADPLPPTPRYAPVNVPDHDARKKA